MDVFEALEERVGRLVEAYTQLRQRTAELEEENRTLRDGGGEAEQLRSRVAELESERDEVRRRLERVLANLAKLGL